MAFPKKPGHGFEPGTPEHREAVARDRKQFRERRRKAIEAGDRETVKRMLNPNRPERLTEIERTEQPRNDSFMGFKVSRTYVSDYVLDDGVPFFGNQYFEGYHRGQIKTQFGEGTGLYREELDRFWKRFLRHVGDSSARLTEARTAPYKKRKADRAARVKHRRENPSKPRLRKPKSSDPSSST